MSRIGRKPVTVPAGVKVQVNAGTRVIDVQGPKGKLSFTHRPEVKVAYSDADKAITCDMDPAIVELGSNKAFWGTTRSVLNGMIEGVTKGYQKELEVVGVGWNAAVQGRKVVLSVGFCKPVEIMLPEGVNAACPTNTLIVLTGYDKQKVGMTASRIRASRKPEPYKGKGVRYKGEYVRLKAGKSFGS